MLLLVGVEHCGLRGARIIMFSCENQARLFPFKAVPLIMEEMASIWGSVTLKYVEVTCMQHLA